MPIQLYLPQIRHLKKDLFADCDINMTSVIFSWHLQLLTGRIMNKLQLSKCPIFCSYSFNWLSLFKTFHLSWKWLCHILENFFWKLAFLVKIPDWSSNECFWTWISNRSWTDCSLSEGFRINFESMSEIQLLKNWFPGLVRTDRFPVRVWSTQNWIGNLRISNKEKALAEWRMSLSLSEN